MSDNLSLETLRKQLDTIDANLVQLYEKRLDICGQVAVYKHQTGKPILDATREQEKIETVRSMAQDRENADAIEHLFTQIMADSRELQAKLIKDMDGETK